MVTAARSSGHMAGTRSSSRRQAHDGHRPGVFPPCVSVAMLSGGDRGLVAESAAVWSGGRSSGTCACRKLSFVHLSSLIPERTVGSIGREGWGLMSGTL